MRAINRYDWQVQTTQKALSFWAFLLKPLLAWNHSQTAQSNLE
jgi:hypothetical protein